MSEIFTAAHNPEIFLYQMANRRATVFVRLTHLAAQIYGVTEEVIIRREDQFQVNAGPFFTLVERAFEHPTDLLYVWASYAAGIYETLKGRSWKLLRRKFEYSRSVSPKTPPRRLAGVVSVCPRFTRSVHLV